VKALPNVSRIRQLDTHRLIPARFSNSPLSILGAIAEDDAELTELARLESLTDEQVLAENDLMPGIGVQELVFGVPHARIVNGAFTHPNPLGSRFNGPTRGAWYAGFEIETSLAEIAFHRAVHLAEIGQFQDEVIYVDYLADFGGEFHDLRHDSAFAVYLNPDSYVQSQSLAERLLAAGSLGTLYPSVRYPGGTCLACFRPSMVSNVRTGLKHQFTWTGEPTPTIATS
jgi:RES domain-containing protein